MRISFVISSQHLIPHGGIGQFTKCFLEQIANDIAVDIVMDKQPSDADFLKLDNNVFVYPAKPVSYKGHQEVFAFADSLNFEKMINFRDSMLKSLGRGIPDLIIVNSIEALPAIFSLGLHSTIPTLVYTHSEYLAGFVDYKASTFTKEFLEFNSMMFKYPGFIIGTQTELNAERILKVFSSELNVKPLPMPIPELELLKPVRDDKEGVLFIGRFEDRKNPEEFIRVIKETQLPARVMTNSTGAKKFKTRFDEEGISNYTIEVGLTGKSKVDFISKSKIYYNPSKLESFGFTMLEGLSQCTTIVLDGYSWSDNFAGANYMKLNKKDVVKSIKDLYSDTIVDSNSWVNDYNKNAVSLWVEFLNQIVSQREAGKHKLKEDEFVLSEYLTKLNRTYSIEDIKTLVNNKKFFNIRDDEFEQYWSLSGQFNINKSSSTLDDFFN